MSLLKSLNLPAPSPATAPGKPADSAAPVGKGVPTAQSTVTLFNFAGADLKLVSSSLQFDSARFVPAPPAVIPAQGKATFRVVEATVGAKKTAGAASYHLDRKRHNIDVAFSWAGATGAVKITGEGPYSQAVQAVEDSDKGNEYKLLFKDVQQPGEDKLQVRVDVANHSGNRLLLGAKVLFDEHTEFNDPPKTEIADKGFDTFFVQALDEEHPEARGSVIYHVDKPGQPHQIDLLWRRGATPVGTVKPNDGSFVVQAKRKGDDGFDFTIESHSGPAPEPRGPARVTIDNTAAFALTHNAEQLDGKAAQFSPKPPAVIDGGRKAQFSVQSSDPEFPEVGGFVKYDFALDPPDPATLDGHHVLTLAWSDTLFSGTISPPAKDCDVAKGGSRDEGFVFTVSGPALEFKPPAKTSKQPTLRKGDKSADGWVEYLQQLLNAKGAKLEVDGDFGGETLKAVKAFQRKFKKEGVLEDGVVGDETWSFLREGAPEKPKTDGLKPHSFVEKGNEARWMQEKTELFYDATNDIIVLEAFSVGDIDQIHGRQARLQIVDPAGRKKVLSRPLGRPIATSKTGQGFRHNVIVKDFKTLFDENAADGPQAGDYQVEAYMPEDLGGDDYKGTLKVEKSK